MKARAVFSDPTTQVPMESEPPASSFYFCICVFRDPGRRLSLCPGTMGPLDAAVRPETLMCPVAPVPEGGAVSQGEPAG